MADGTVRFVADTSAFNAPLKEAAQSALGVATAAEDARQRIVNSYQAQIKAAQEMGASQRDLAAITRQVTSMMASVNEDNAKRYINAIDRMEDRTRRFNAARSTISSLPTAQPESSFSLGGYSGETAAAKELTGALGELDGAHTSNTRSAVQFGAVIRGLEGNFTRNVRAAEYFAASLGALQPIMAVAFPIVGAVALGAAIFEMGKHAYEAWQNVVNLKSAIEGLNSLQVNTDADAQRDKDAVETAVEGILTATSGRAAALSQKLSYQSNKGIDLTSFFGAKEFKGLPDDVKGNLESTYKNIAPADIPGRLKTITDSIGGLNAALAGLKDGSVTAFNMPSFFGAAPNTMRDPAAYYEAQLNAAEQIKKRLSGANDVRTAGLQLDQTDGQKAQQEEAQKAAQASLEAQRKAQEEQRAQWATELVEWQASGTQTAAAIASWWATKAVAFSAGSANFNYAMKQANEELVKVNADTNRRLQDFNKSVLKLGQDQLNGVAKGPSLANANDDAKNYAEWANNQNRYRLAKQQAGYADTEAAIQTAVATGELTKHDAAIQLAALHTQEYADAIAEINDLQKNLDGNTSLTNAQRTAQQSGIKLQQQQADGKRSVQIMQDSANLAADSWQTAMHKATMSWLEDATDTGKQVADIFMGALNGFNQNISALMTGGNANFAGMFRNIGQQTANAGLKHLEAPIVGALGLGKADGSSSSPFYVKNADGTTGELIGGSSGGSSGGMFGSFGKSIMGLFGGGASGPGYDGLDMAQGIAMGGGPVDTIGSALSSDLLPGLAIGGATDANSSYLVGERGPEVLTMGSQAGRITPNSQLGGGGGHTFNIDARGSSDPAQTTAQIQRALQQAMPSFVGASVRAVGENNKRMPTSARR